MHAWILEDIFGRRWRLSLEAPLAGAALSQTRAVNAIERLASFVYDSALRVDRRNAVAFGEIGERLGSGLDGWPTGFEAEDILLGNEGMDAQLCFGRALTRLLEDAVIVGRLHVQELPEARGMFDPPAPRPDRPAPVAPKPSEPTWFEVRVVDTFGRPVSGVGLVLARGARRETTNAAGVARWAGVEAEVSLSAVKVADLATLRERLLPEWGRGATSAGLRPEGTRASLFADEVSAQVWCEEPLTLILENPVRRVRLVGMHFDTNKCFLLPSAMPGIRRVRHIYERTKTTQYLVVGHTDTNGDWRYNEALSLERARAIVAYLQDDAAAWMAWFSTRHDEKRWAPARSPPCSRRCRRARPPSFARETRPPPPPSARSSAGATRPAGAPSSSTASRATSRSARSSRRTWRSITRAFPPRRKSRRMGAVRTSHRWLPRMRPRRSATRPPKKLAAWTSSRSRARQPRHHEARYPRPERRSTRSG